jgi:hypothetical protein
MGKLERMSTVFENMPNQFHKTAISDAIPDRAISVYRPDRATVFGTN